MSSATPINRGFQHGTPPSAGQVEVPRAGLADLPDEARARRVVRDRLDREVSDERDAHRGALPNSQKPSSGSAVDPLRFPTRPPAAQRVDQDDHRFAILAKKQVGCGTRGGFRARNRPVGLWLAMSCTGFQPFTWIRTADQVPGSVRGLCIDDGARRG